jgi:hypothetical protein
MFNMRQVGGDRSVREGEAGRYQLTSSIKRRRGTRGHKLKPLDATNWYLSRVPETPSISNRYRETSISNFIIYYKVIVEILGYDLA